MKTALRGMSTRGAGANEFVLAKMATSARAMNVERCMVTWSFVMVMVVVPVVR
jgi:hypothetical protein